VAFELKWLREIDFFPHRPDPERLGELGSICIGTKQRSIGDALAISTLPRKLKAKFPGLRVTVYPRGFNPVVVANNPAISGVQRLPRAVYGDDAIWGSGHQLTLKEEFFGLETSALPRPEIYLSESEKLWALGVLPEAERPVCVLHPWGSTRSRVLSTEQWASIVAASPGWRFWQVGVEGDLRIPGCERAFLMPRKPWEARKLFALMSRVQAFLGCDSGPMHVAAAFSIPSLVFLDHLGAYRDTREVFELRHREPYFVRQHFRYAVLYEQNEHVNVLRESGHVARRSAEFLEKLLA
jgi:ADP-heptose:LPS heptosyltransferase